MELKAAYRLIYELLIYLIHCVIYGLKLQYEQWWILSLLIWRLFFLVYSIHSYNQQPFQIYMYTKTVTQISIHSNTGGSFSLDVATTERKTLCFF